LTIEEAAERLA